MTIALIVVLVSMLATVAWLLRLRWVCNQRCPLCDCRGYVQRRPRISAYVDEESNWLTSCEDCYERDCDELRDRWADYYGGVSPI